MRRKRLIYLALAALLLAGAALIGGCAAQDAGASLQGGEPNCTENSDCPADQMCRAGLCSVRAAAATNLDFRFIPPSSSDFLAQQIDDVQVRTEQVLDFGLERAITVNSGESATNNEGGPSGGIRYADRIKGPSGTLLFGPARVGSQLLSQEARVNDGSFSAQITPGRYSLTFVPEDRAMLPKKTWPEEEFESNTYLLRTLRAPEELIPIAGLLTRNKTIGEMDVENEPVAGARVYAISTDGLHTSTVVTTNESGNFSLKVEPNTGVYDLFVVPTEASPLVLSSVFEKEFEVAEDQCIPKSGRPSPTCNISPSLGAYPAEPVKVSVALETAGDADGSADFAGTTVVVTGAVAAGTYTRKKEVEFSEESGRWQAELELFPVAWSFDELPQYTIEIVPPTRSPYARTTHTLEGALDLEAVHGFMVDVKRQMRGEVLDSEGRPVSAAKLDFRVADGGDGESHDTRALSVTTEEDGSFEVWLEQADYEVFIVPPPSTGQPRVLTDVRAASLQAGDELVLELPRPAVLVGSVFGASDGRADEFSAIADVTVEAFKEVDGRTIVFGQGRTDSNGEFQMAISSEL
jgi:hypothetical protein